MNYCALLIAALWTATVWAESIPITNYSFEQPELGTEGQDILPDVPGWKASGTAGVFANIGKYGNEMDGANGGQVAFLNGTKAGELSQDVLPTIRPSMTYLLSVSVGLREDSPLAKG